MARPVRLRGFPLGPSIRIPIVNGAAVPKYQITKYPPPPKKNINNKVGRFVSQSMHVITATV